MKPQPGQSPHEFWEEVYSGASQDTTGRPSAVLERFAIDRAPGRALDLGCAKGDDAIWLAGRGWKVTAVDISMQALKLAQMNAACRVVGDRISFEKHDLTQTFPAGRFDLISAMFLQTPFSFPRSDVVAKAASKLNSGGLLLLVTHGSAAPWSWAKHDHVFPTAAEERGEIGLQGTEWRDEFVGGLTRLSTGPSGETVEVIDNVIAISRLGGS